jgi:hypothetical protein
MLEISEEKRKSAGTFDSCVVEIPKEFALANGLPEKSFVSLTLRNGKLESEIIVYTDEDEKEVGEFLKLIVS